MLNSSITLSQISYPVDKETYGRALWSVIHSYTSNLPERLSKVDKIKFRQTVHDLLDKFPCEDCKKAGHAWISDHKPNFNTAKDAFVWSCDFHNAVNEKLGKPRQDCYALWESRANCPSCSTTPQKRDTGTESGTNPETHEEPEPINAQLGAPPSTPDNNTTYDKHGPTELGIVKKSVNQFTPSYSSSLQSNNEPNSSNDGTKNNTNIEGQPIQQLGPPLPSTNTDTSDEKQYNEKNSLNVTQLGAPPLQSPTSPTSEETQPISNQQHKSSSKISQFSIKPSLEQYKNVSTKMFENLCKNAGLPIPELIFSDKTGCSDPNHSCTHFQNGAPTRVYLNTNQYSPRSIVHEFLHYFRKVKGMDFKNEQEISRQSREMIARDFPVGLDSQVKQTATAVEVKDESLKESFDPLRYYKEHSKARLNTFTDSLPYFSRYYHPNKRKHQGQQPSPQVQPTVTYSDGRPVFPEVATQPPEEQEPASMSDGFVSMLDPVFAPFAQILGMKARDVNLAHTPALIATGGIVLAESNLNKFGSMIASLVASLVTLGAGALTKDQIGLTDKKLLVGMGGLLFWNGALRYVANPKTMSEVIEEATHFGSSIQSMDFQAMLASVTTSDGKRIPEKEPFGRLHEKEPNWRKNLSSPVGGQGVPVTSYERRGATDDLIYEYPENAFEEHGVLGSSQGTAFRRTDPFFPSMT